MSWVEWKKKLLDAFPSRINSCATFRRMLAREQYSNETYLRYFFEKSAVVIACKIEGYQIVFDLFLGLWPGLAIKPQ